jgi:ornithine cyclodeaminase
LRTILRPAAESSVFASMPCHVAGDGYGVKAIMLKPDNEARGLPVHVGALLLFSPDNGYPVALLDAAAITAVRTAAVSAVATDALADANAGDLAVIGSGVQARSHLEAMALVRNLRRVRVWSRTPARAEDFRGWAAAHLGVDVEVRPSVSAATEGADLVCTTTSATEPVVAASDLARGAHVNAVGASVASARELTSAAVARCAVFVDSRESAANEAGDLRTPLHEGVIGADHVRAELGEVLLGRVGGRSGADEITLFKSLGLAAQDVASGFAVVRAAHERGLGDRVSYGPHGKG